MTARLVEHPNYAQAATLGRVAFWTSLPDANTLSAPALALLRESDGDIREERLESALEASFGLNSAEPAYLPGYIRTAELLIATRRMDHAHTLLDTVIHHQNTFGNDEFDFQLAKLQAHVEHNVDLTLKLAKRIIQQPDRDLLVPYVPAAIDQLMTAERGEEAVEIASAWVDATPDSPLAISNLVRAHLAMGSGASALQVIRRFREAYDADRIWPENIAVSALAAIASDDVSPKWIAAGPVCKGLRDKSINYQHVTALLEFLVPVVDSSQRALLFAGLIAVNAGDMDEARALLQTTPGETLVEAYLRSVGLERVASSTDSSQVRSAALSEIWTTLNDPQVESISTTSEIFDPPATQSTVALAIAQSMRDSEAYNDALQFLNEVIQTGNDDPQIIRMQAEIMGKAGSRSGALQELEKLAQRQEGSHQYGPANETLNAMLRLVPGNIRLRARVVENALKVGNFEVAIDQLVTQGRLLQKAGRLPEAEPPIHRAIQIATMVNDWETVNKLHRLLINFDPDDTRLRHAAVTTYVQYGRTSDAMNQLREIVRVAQKRNEPDEAIAASHQMLALDPNDPSTYHQLGELLISIQEYSQADRVYRRLANITPDDPAVKAKRSAIAALSRSRQQSGG